VEIEDFKRMLKQYKKERDKLILKVLFFTGMRASELCHLEKSHI
jgi:integrase